MLKIRRPLGRLIFNMGIAIPGKTVFLIETASRLLLIIMDHLLIPVITLHLLIVAKKHSIAKITKLRSLDLLIKTPLLHILYHINGLTHDFWTLHPIDNRSRNKRRNLWVGRCVSSWLPWFPSRSSVLIYMCVYIYIYMYIPYTSSVIGRIYNGCVIQYWRSCTPSRSIGLFLGSARFLGWMPLYVFFGLPIVSCSLIKV